jgi:hypothetical protein
MMEDVEMTSKADFTLQWKDSTPYERRQRLNELGSNTEKDDELWREHDALAAMVALDEEKVARGIE